MSAGKGDKPRKVDGDKFRANWESIFNKQTAVKRTPPHETRNTKDR